MISGKDISHASSIIWQEGLPPRLKLEGACRFEFAWYGWKFDHITDFGIPVDRIYTCL
jgi:hypothetical protein